MLKRLFQGGIVSVVALASILVLPGTAFAHHGSASGKCVNNEGVITAKFEAFGDRSHMLGNITVNVDGQKIDDFKPNADNFTRTYKPYDNGSYVVKANWIMDWNKNGKVDSGESFGFTSTFKIEGCEPKVEMCQVSGKGHLPKNDPSCREDEVEKCKIVGKEHLPKDDPNCKQEPQVLPETTLPVTGPGLEILALPGIVALAGYLFKAKRQKLKIVLP